MVLARRLGNNGAYCINSRRFIKASLKNSLFYIHLVKCHLLTYYIYPFLKFHHTAKHVPEQIEFPFEPTNTYRALFHSEKNFRATTRYWRPTGECISHWHPHQGQSTSNFFETPMTTNCSIIKVQDSSNRLEIELTMSGQWAKSFLTKSVWNKSTIAKLILF